MILQGHVMSHVSSSAFKCLQISSKIYCNRYVPKSICKINKVGVSHQTITSFLSDLENNSLRMDILFNFLDSLFWTHINIHQISVSKFHTLSNTSISFKEFVWFQPMFNQLINVISIYVIYKKIENRIYSIYRSYLNLGIYSRLINVWFRGHYPHGHEHYDHIILFLAFWKNIII